MYHNINKSFYIQTHILPKAMSHSFYVQHNFYCDLNGEPNTLKINPVKINFCHSRTKHTLSNSQVFLS